MSSASEPQNTEPYMVKEVTELTDRELLEEITLRLRDFANAIEMLAENPMVGALMSGKSPMEALMGR